MRGFKLLRKRKDGSLGPLFINRSLRIRPGVWYDFEVHPTRGYKLRPGWHILPKPEAPHLSPKGRVWREVEFDPMATITRPVNQGGVWFLGSRMKVVDTPPGV